MDQNKKHFSFDDEDDMENKKEENVISLDTIINDVEEQEEDSMKNKKTKKQKKQKKPRKFKLRVWHVLLALVVIAGGIFAYYVYDETKTDGPVYGDRCIGALAIDDSVLENTAIALTNEDPNMPSMEIKKECKTIKVTVKVVDGIDRGGVEQELAPRILNALNTNLGYPTDEGAKYSQVFNSANGVLQYDITFRFTKDAEDGVFPIFGTKHAGDDEISITDSAPVPNNGLDQIPQEEIPEV